MFSCQTYAAKIVLMFSNNLVREHITHFTHYWPLLNLPIYLLYFSLVRCHRHIYGTGKQSTNKILNNIKCNHITHVHLILVISAGGESLGSGIWTMCPSHLGLPPLGFGRKNLSCWWLEVGDYLFEWILIRSAKIGEILPSVTFSAEV